MSLTLSVGQLGKNPIRIEELMQVAKTALNQT